MRVLITGGAGFIGSHLCDALLARGDLVHVVDDLSTGCVDNIAHLRDHPRFEYTIGGLSERSLLAELIDDCDVIFHLAAAVGVKLIVQSPVGEAVQNNIFGTEVVLSLAAKKLKPVLVASTSEVYGLSQQVPFREDGPLVLGATTKGMELRLLKGHRRVPCPGLLAGTRAADCDRAVVQYGRPKADRALWNGCAHVRQASPRRSSDHRPR